MALVTMKKLLEQASKERRGVGAFSVGNMEMVKGAVQAAEEMNTPIILQIAEVRLPHSPLALMGPMMVQAAKEAKVDVAENIERTKEVAELAKGYGATVEAELGLVGGSEDGSEDHGIRCTDPEDAKIFCERTGIDALAVAIGNAHGNYPVAPTLAFDVLEEIEKRTEVPLVLHGGSGITDDDFRRAISLGIVKVNIATASFNQLTKRAEGYFQTEGAHNYFKLNEAMVQGTYENVRHHIEVFNCR